MAATSASPAQKRKFDLVSYFKMSDPVRAAELMLRDAHETGKDIDRIFDQPAKAEISLPHIVFTPDANDRSFVESFQDSIDAEDPVCLIKLSRWPSIRETSDLLARGIRIFRGQPYATYIARIPPQHLAAVFDLPFVTWVGHYRPEYKYDPDELYVPDKPLPAHDIIVRTWVNVSDEHRRDLERIGVTITGTLHMGYTLKPDLSKVPAVASLWWVEAVYQQGALVND